jgi:hypothetical protein
MKKLRPIALAGVAVIALLLGAWNFYEIQKIYSTLDDIRWNQVVDEFDRQDTITADVGNIQFIKENAFSIELEKVAYTADGLYLKGYVGNATQVDVTNLGLRLIASKEAYSMREDYNKSKDKEVFALFTFPTIGIAQADPIPILLHGDRAEFEATIPNVRQTKDGVRIRVVFTGERYSYPS